MTAGFTGLCFNETGPMKARKGGVHGTPYAPLIRFNETGPMKARKASWPDRMACFNETGPMKARKVRPRIRGAPQGPASMRPGR